MSIISEALKRAHLETVRHDRPQRQRWASRTPGTVDYPEPRSWRKRFPIVLGIANVVIVLLAGGFLYFRNGNATPLIPNRSIETPSVTSAALPATVPRPVGIGATTPPPAVAIKERPRNPKPRHPTTMLEQVPVAVRPLRQITSAEDDGPRTLDGLVEGKTYVETVPAPDGHDLTLFGLTKAGDRGAALINGRVVWEGERVGGFRIERVERNRVALRYADIRVFLVLP